MRSTAHRRRSVRRTILLVALLALAGCGGDAKQEAASRDDGVRDLANVLELRSDFEAESGKTRVIVLLSPT